ncbi:Gp138 family membrane-puncturing spike protein [Methylorubrum suomiense]|uniref:Phage protein Gp138 N-terminal domain-containing protein n=1 Tax=Methylorubrum suomiense TaxID=144191 RepID=A0ABQ4UYK0_9HYPH|nr:Gp138 family membrane-puncturing spike protein [Methylorubrum suomiense]GJE77292.1 hypothetical protein BGCPKDLD_3895 [Methylorubrum suomiense]
MAGHQGSSTRRSVDEMLAALIETERADIFTNGKGVVVSYDPKTQTATIRPKLSMMIAGEKVAAPELQSVPISHTRIGNFIIHGNLQGGDEVDLDYSQRPLDEAIEDGSDQSGNRSGRMHSLSDATARPAAHSKGKQLSDMPSDRMHIGSTDGKSGLQMKSDGSFDLVRNGDSLWKVIEDLAMAFRDHTNNDAENNKKAEAQAIVDRIAKIKAS